MNSAKGRRQEDLPPEVHQLVEAEARQGPADPQEEEQERCHLGREGKNRQQVPAEAAVTDRTFEDQYRCIQRIAQMMADAGLDTEPLAEQRELLGGHVAGGGFVPREGAAPEPADRGVEACHAQRMEVWASLRMNDIHKDWVEMWPSLRSPWELARPHVKIGAQSTDYYRRRWPRTGQPSNGFTWAFDYALAEVRDLKFSLIEEMCAQYDVDGFEMDFLSSPIYFKRGEVQRGMPQLTQFVRRVRQRLDEIGQQKGRQQ